MEVFSILNEAGFERHRHADTLLNICGQVGLPRRLSLGECLTCESHRSQKRFDLFLQGQDLFHLFLMGDVCSVKQKRHNSNEWESMSNLESDPPVEDAGVTEKQPEKQPEEGGSQQPEGLVVPALDLESDPPVEDAGVTEKQPEEGRNLDPEPEEAAAMEDKEEVAAETAQAKSTAKMKAEKKEAKAKSTSEMKAKKKEAAQAELIAEMEAKKNKAAQAESNVEMEDKSTSEMKAKKKEAKEKAAQAELIAEMEAKKNKAAQAESSKWKTNRLPR
jgi:hypothetical protein